MSGTVKISRTLWDDTAFQDSEFSQREAWIWMIAEASWKGRARRIGAKEVWTERGQLVVSSRFCAKAWRWSEPRVRRYFDMLENRRMIERVTDAGITVISICKYDDYQSKPRVGDAPSTHQPTHHRRTTDANDKKEERRRKDKEEEESHARATEPNDEDLSLYRRALAASGWNSRNRPAYWQPHIAAPHIAAWRDRFDLTPLQIETIGREQVEAHGPPDGPKAWDRSIVRYARARASPSAAPKTSPAKRIRANPDDFKD